MKVILINPTYYSVYDLGLSYGEPLGLAYIAAVIEKSGRHSVEVIDSVGLATEFHKVGDKTRMGLPEEQVIQMVHDRECDVIGIALIGTMYAQEILQFIGQLKKTFPQVPIVVGGVHATLEHEKCMRKAPIDVIVLGEGEGTIIDLLDALEVHKDLNLVAGIVFREQSSGNLVKTKRRGPLSVDEIPLPARHLFPMKNYFENRPRHYYRRHPAASLITSRACPFNCIFCSTTLFWEKKYRARNPLAVVDEIENLVKVYHVKEILINDDCFLANKRRVSDICDEIIKRELNITYQVPPGVNFHLLDEELLRKLRDSGLYAIKPQLESGNENTLKYIRKKIALEDGKRIISCANRLGIWTQTNCILGFPHETREEILASIRYMESVPFDNVSYIVPIPFTHTELREDYIKNKLIQPDDPVKMDSPVDSVHLKKEEIVTLRNWAQRRQVWIRMKRLLTPSFFFREFLPKINTGEKFMFLIRRILKSF